MSDEKVHLNGKLIDAAEARISVGDVGFLHGGSVFTTLGAFHGQPFRLDRHVNRLLATAELLGMRVGTDAETLARAVDELLAANALDRARLRITLTPGDVRTDEPTALITAVDLPAYPPEWFTDGITVVVSSYTQWQGDPTYGHKTGCYFPRILARQEAHRKGATEALWFTAEKHLAEGCFTNVFLVCGGTVLTPPRDTPVLPGVTRAAVLELCGELGIPSNDQNPLTVKEMLAAEEIFLTAGTMGLVPVAHVERHDVGDATIGPITRRLTEAYWTLVDRETAPPR